MSGDLSLTVNLYFIILKVLYFTGVTAYLSFVCHMFHATILGFFVILQDAVVVPRELRCFCCEILHWLGFTSFIEVLHLWGSNI
jgi:hypothetical protein